MKKMLFSLVALALIGSLFLGGCSGEAERPIKIGVLAALTGPLATAEAEAVHAIELALEEVDYEVAGRQIELVVEDITYEPGLALTKVKKLNEMDEVDVVIGPVRSVSGLAIRDYIDENQLLWVSHMCASPEFTGDQYTKYFFRSSYAYTQENAVAAYIAYEVKGYRNVVAIPTDTGDGRGEWQGFKDVFEAMGGTVVQEIYTPVQTPDFGPYMAQIDVENADFIWTFQVGGDAIRFVTALDEYGIKDKLPVFCSATITADSWLAPMGDAALGIETASHYSTALDRAENVAFVQAIWDNYEHGVAEPAEHAYVATRMVISAIEAVDGNVEDVDGMIEALEALELEAPRGPIKFESHTPVQNVYHRTVERVDGKLQNTVLETYANIGPVWMPSDLE